MRILHLLYAQRESSAASGSKARSKFPWADVLLTELGKDQSVTLALAMPVKDGSFQKRIEDRMTLYDLPNPEEENIFKKIYQRINRLPENTNINTYASQAISDFKPDIIQIFGTENPFGLIIGQQNIPVIIHIQGYLVVWKGKWFTGISKWDQLRYGALKDQLRLTSSYFEYFTFKKRAEREEIIIKKCRYFMGRTGFDKRIASLMSPDSTYFHCEEFIRNIFFSERWNCQLQNEIICVSILKGTSYKGIDVLVETALILKRFNAISVTFKICGVTEREEIIQIIKKKYRVDFKKLGIEFLGRLTSDDLVRQLCNANFYIHPSFIENSPNSVCEAMALGMPVISTNTGGLSTLINDNVDGILVQEGEPYSLAAAINNLTGNYEYAKLLGENARKRSVARHDPDQIVKQLLGIYETIIIENGRK